MYVIYNLLGEKQLMLKLEAVVKKKKDGILSEPVLISPLPHFPFIVHFHFNNTFRFAFNAARQNRNDLQ